MATKSTKSAKKGGAVNIRGAYRRHANGDHAFDLLVFFVANRIAPFFFQVYV
jgi:hypothetical protein